MLFVHVFILSLSYFILYSLCLTHVKSDIQLMKFKRSFWKRNGCTLLHCTGVYSSTDLQVKVCSQGWMNLE